LSCLKYYASVISVTIISDIHCVNSGWNRNNICTNDQYNWCIQL